MNKKHLIMSAYFSNHRVVDKARDFNIPFLLLWEMRELLTKLDVNFFKSMGVAEFELILNKLGKIGWDFVSFINPQTILLRKEE